MTSRHPKIRPQARNSSGASTANAACPLRPLFFQKAGYCLPPDDATGRNWNTAMPTLPHRTNATSLSDDDLLLFDSMFPYSVPEDLLRRDSYPAQMNVQYSHALDDHCLRERLHSLMHQGLVVGNGTRPTSQTAHLRIRGPRLPPKRHRRRASRRIES